MKQYNDGDGLDAPRFIPVGKEPVKFIPVGKKDDDYMKDSQGNYWLKTDWEKMRIK
jgi:nitrous oxidase accessory protein NosD